MLGEESFAQRERVKIVAPPQTYGTFISCERFLTNFDVGERKQHTFVTISCERKQIFKAAIRKHETTVLRILKSPVAQVSLDRRQISQGHVCPVGLNRFVLTAG